MSKGSNGRVFIMKNTVPCVTALEMWLRRRPFFNGYTVDPVEDQATPIDLVHTTDPGGNKKGKIKGYRGRIMCLGEPDSEAFRMAERSIRAHLGWPPVDYENKETA